MGEAFTYRCRMDRFDWRTATDAEVDHEYSPSRFALRPLPEYFAEYRERSTRRAPGELSIPGRPLLVYIHGGYWQRLSAADSLFVADDAVARGVSLHAVEYTLAPEGTIPGMIAECVADIVASVDRLGPSRTVVAGCSAGAHLTAMCARDPEVARRIDGVALLSGIFDVRPFVRTGDNAALGLDDASASAVSPQLLDGPVGLHKAICAVGGHESSEFIRQNAEYAELLRSRGCDTSDAVVSHRDHFDLPYDLLARGTTVGDWVLDTLEVDR